MKQLIITTKLKWWGNINSFMHNLKSVKISCHLWNSCDQKLKQYWAIKWNLREFFLQVALYNPIETILSASCFNVVSQLPSLKTVSANKKIPLSCLSQTNKICYEQKFWFFLNLAGFGGLFFPFSSSE